MLRSAITLAVVGSFLAVGGADTVAQRSRNEVLADGCVGSTSAFTDIRLQVGDLIRRSIYSMSHDSRRANIVLKMATSPRVSFDYAVGPADREGFNKKVADCFMVVLTEGDVAVDQRCERRRHLRLHRRRVWNVVEAQA
jgi:hypothetical protein